MPPAGQPAPPGCAPTVWITGAAGLIGSHLLRLNPELAPTFRPVPLTRAVLDLTDRAAVERRFAADQPDFLIHGAGLTRSPWCEREPELARRLNVEVTGTLHALFAGRPMVFFSTDLVFDGRRGGYREGDPVSPLGVYGRTKADAEALVLSDPAHHVVRTSLNYGRSPTGDRSFSEELLRAWREGRETPLFTDEFRCPIAAAVTAGALWRWCAIRWERGAAAVPRVLHVAGTERLSRWELGQLLAARHPDLHPRLRAASLREYQGAPRPPDTSLDCALAEQVLGEPLPRFSAWLAAQPPEADGA